MSHFSGQNSNNVTNTPNSRKSITVLVLGDEAVGKSSLISTYVSRHFADGVPGIMTRVRLPPEPISGIPNATVVTTIVDSQSGDAALVSAVTARSLSSPHSSSGSLSSMIKKQQQQKAKEQQQQQQQQQGGGGGGNSSGIISGVTAATPSSSPPGIENVDSIVLVYDLNRVETFYRLENHWLPLIEKCYNGEVPVIVAGNKMDVYRPSSTTELSRSRQQISSLLQRFKFVLQWIKCSAKNLLHIDEVFHKAQQAVLYPITPLYDLTTAQLTPNCRRALTRIFRICDRDNDGLLSNIELDLFQRQAFPTSRLVEGDNFAGWQKIVPRMISSNDTTNSGPAIVDGKFTVTGFLAIFEIFITQNRLESPWRALRCFGYDDDLNLTIPSFVINNTTMDHPQATTPSSGKSKDDTWELSPSARNFLKNVFEQFDSDKDGFLSTDDIQNIFSIIPEPSLPPWHPNRASRLFGECFSLPKIPSSSSCSTDNDDAGLSTSFTSLASGIAICSGASSSSVDMSASFVTDDDLSSSMIQPLSFFDWMGNWHMISAISPEITRTELYRLGHVEIARSVIKDVNNKHHQNQRSKVTVGNASAGGDQRDSLPSCEVRTLLLGLHGQTESFMTPSTNSTCVKIKRNKTTTPGGKTEKAKEDLVAYIISTELPSTYPEHQWKDKPELSSLIIPEKSGSSKQKKAFDMVTFTFDCTKPSSLLYAIDHAALLNDDVPRTFVATKLDETDAAGLYLSSQKLTLLEDASRYCKNLDIEPPFLTSEEAIGGSSSKRNVNNSNTNKDDNSSNAHDDSSKERIKVLEHVARCAPHLGEKIGLDELLKSRPQAEKNRRNAARRRKIRWLIGVASVGLSVALAIGYARGKRSQK